MKARSQRLYMFLSIGTALLTMAVKFIGYLLTRSTGLFSDAADTIAPPPLLGPPRSYPRNHYVLCRERTHQDGELLSLGSSPLSPASFARTMACARSATWSLLTILET